MGPLSPPKRLVDTAIFDGIEASVGTRVVNQVMHVLTDQESPIGVAQHLHAGGVGKGTIALQVNAINRLGSRIH